MFPPQPTLATAPRLTEPLWQRQAGEGDEDWAAFCSWVDCRDWHRVGALCGLTQQAALETATRWAWHARTRAWDAEKASEGATERKAHAASVQAARDALPALLQAASTLALDLLEFAHSEHVAHRTLADKQAAGEAGGARMPYLSWKEVLTTSRVAQQAVRDLERIARPITPDSASAGTVPGEGTWDYSKLPAEQLRAIQLARAAAKAQ